MIFLVTFHSMKKHRKLKFLSYLEERVESSPAFLEEETVAAL